MSNQRTLHNTPHETQHGALAAQLEGLTATLFALSTAVYAIGQHLLPSR